MKKSKKIILLLSVLVLLLTLIPAVVLAEGNVDVNINGDNADTLDIIFMLTAISLIPSILIMTTCFTRIVIVLSFLRNALGLQQTPPNQVLVGIALFLSLFIMSPVISQINEQAYTPYKEEQITQEEFVKEAAVPIKEFMLKQTDKPDLDLFISLSKSEIKENKADYDITTIIPAFVTSELKRAFTMGFLIFIPFLIIDMIVSSALMSMGMIMLPPVMISLPFKLLLFIMVDGWGLMFKTLATSFNF